MIEEKCDCGNEPLIPLEIIEYESEKGIIRKVVCIECQYSN